MIGAPFQGRIGFRGPGGFGPGDRKQPFPEKFEKGPKQ
jgi:hypothetical protein